MEGLSNLVSASFARHGVADAVDHRRLLWSKWSRCNSSFSVLLAPGKPGLIAVGEEPLAPCEGRRVLILLQMLEVEDIGLALGKLFLPGCPLRERLMKGSCFARYAVVEDAIQRQAAYRALRRWMAPYAHADLADSGTCLAGSLGNAKPEIEGLEKVCK